MITVGAPGKLMLFGEHAVVYGHPCIVTAVDQYLTVAVEKNIDGKTKIEAPQVKDTRFIDAVLGFITKKYDKDTSSLTIRTNSSFSGVFGFGSSSAVTVAALKALFHYFAIPVTPRQLFDAAYGVVLEVQKVGSGFDVAASVFGGTLFYTRGATELVDLASPASHMQLVIGYSGIKANTVDIVNTVAAKREKYPEKVDRIFGAIGKLVSQAKVALEEKDWESVGKFMNFNQEYLRDLGVSTQKLEDLITAATHAGAFGAKLSGAGGGDCMIALVSAQTRGVVEKAIIAAGGDVVRVGINAPGADQQTTDNQNELFIVVDKNDAIIGYKTRYDCHRDPSLIHRTIGVCIKDSKGRVLLQKRSKTKDMDAGLWGLSCAGHVTKGQEYEEAAHRELKEELGVDTPITFVARDIVGDAHETEMAALFEGVHNGPFTPNTREIDEVRFFDPRDIVLHVASKKMKITFGTKFALQSLGIPV